MKIDLRARDDDDDDDDSSHRGAIIGGSVGGALVLLILLVILFWLVRRRRRHLSRRREDVVLITDPVPQVIGSPTTDTKESESDPVTSIDSSHNTSSSGFTRGAGAFAMRHHSDTKRNSTRASHTRDESELTSESGTAESSSALIQENAALRRELDDMRSQMESVASSSSVAGNVSHAADSEVGPGGIQPANLAAEPPPKYTPFRVANQ